MFDEPDGLCSLDQSEPIEYRSVTEDDLNQLLKIEAEVFTVDAWDKTTLRHFIALRNSRWQIATVDKQIVGYCMYLEEAGNTIHIGNLAVVEAHRRKRIGQALLAWMLSEAGKLPAGRVYLEVSTDSCGARALYKTAGFVESRILPRHYGNSDGIEMVLSGPLPKAACI